MTREGRENLMVPRFFLFNMVPHNLVLKAHTKFELCYLKYFTKSYYLYVLFVKELFCKIDILYFPRHIIFS